MPSPLSKLELEALKSFAGAAARGPEAAVEVLNSTGATADDCENAHARALWAVMDAKVRAGEALDAVTLSEACTGVPRALVTDVVVDAAMTGAEGRFALLHEQAQRRRYVEALRQVARVVSDKAQPLANGIAEAAKLLGQWQEESRHVRPMDDTLHALVDELEAVQQGQREPTLRTGLEAWDSVCGGLPPTLTVVGALPGVGKSALVAALCRNLARRNVTVGLLSLEDERGWLTRRLVAEAANVPVFLLAHRPLTNHQLGAVGGASGPVFNWLRSVLCDDRGGLTVAEVVSSARQMIARGAKCVLVDHLGEIRLSRSERHDLDIAEALAELRRLAKAHRVPVVVVAHLRRRDGLNPDSEPKLTDFAFSAGIERMARLAIGLYRDGDQLRAAVLKQTQGAAGLSFGLLLKKSAAIVTEAPNTAETASFYDSETP